MASEDITTMETHDMTTPSTLEADSQERPRTVQAKAGLSRTAVAGAVAGNALEFYDFVIYAFFAVYIGRAFFPIGGEFGSLLASMATGPDASRR
jgi:hypothetical protein